MYCINCKSTNIDIQDGVNGSIYTICNDCKTKYNIYFKESDDEGIDFEDVNYSSPKWKL